jgi:hypothetical protein
VPFAGETKHHLGAQDVCFDRVDRVLNDWPNANRGRKMCDHISAVHKRGHQTPLEYRSVRYAKARLVAQMFEIGGGPCREVANC